MSALFMSWTHYWISSWEKDWLPRTLDQKAGREHMPQRVGEHYFRLSTTPAHWFYSIYIQNELKNLTYVLYCKYVAMQTMLLENQKNF